MKLGVLLFNDFELLDVFGPLEMLGQLKDKLTIYMVASAVGKVKSSPGPEAYADKSFHDEMAYDILLVPGGMGTRTEVENPQLIQWIAKQAEQVKYLRK